MTDALLLVHVLAGGLGLLCAPVAALVRKRRGLHTAAGWIYCACVLALCASALLMVVRDLSLWPFVPLAVGTSAAAAGGVVSRRRARPGWLPRHVQLLLGSYVSFVTAFTVQTVGGLLSWLVPVVVGSTVVSVVTARTTAPRAVAARAQRTAASASGSVKAPA